MKKMSRTAQITTNGGSSFSDPFYSYYMNGSSTSFKIKYGQDYANGTGCKVTIRTGGRTYTYYPQ